MEEMDIESVVDAEVEEAEEDYDSEESDLEYLVDDFDSSNLERDLDRFTEEFQEEMEKLEEPEFRYEDGFIYGIWDTESRAFVSYQLDIKEDGNWKSILGPNLDNYEVESLSGMKTHVGSESVERQQEAEKMQTSDEIMGLKSAGEESTLEALPYPNLLWAVLVVACIATVSRPDD
jgi:hypothetical protein